MKCPDSLQTQDVTSLYFEKLLNRGETRNLYYLQSLQSAEFANAGRYNTPKLHVR